MAIKVNGTDIPNGAEFYVNSSQVQEAYCNGVLVWWFDAEPPEEVPEAITDFTASDNLTGRVRIEFTPSSNATEHDLYRDGSMVKDKVISGFEDTIAAGTYTYYVNAQNSTGDTDSNTDNGTSIEEQGGTPPSIISNFSASDNVMGAIVVSFSSATGDPIPTHDLVNVSTGSVIIPSVTPGQSWSTTQKNVLLRVDAKNTEGTTPSNTDYGSALSSDQPISDFTASDTECRKVVIQYTVPSSSTSQDLWIYDTVYTTGWVLEQAGVSPGYSTSMNSAYYNDTFNFKVVANYSDGSTVESNEDTGTLYIPPLGFEGSNASGAGGVGQIVFSWSNGNSDIDEFDIMDMSVQSPLFLSLPSSMTSYTLTSNDPVWEDHMYDPGQQWEINAFGSKNGCDAREGSVRFSAYATRPIDPPGQQTFTSNGTFVSPNGYTYVSLCMCGSGGMGTVATSGALGGGMAQVVSTTYGTRDGEVISVTVPVYNSFGGNGETAFFGTQGASGGTHSSYRGNGGNASSCGGSSKDGYQDATTSSWGGQSSGFGPGGDGHNGAGGHAGVGSGGGAGVPPNYGGNGGRGEVRVSWGYRYWEVISGYNEMSNKDKWSAIEEYNNKHNIPTWMIFDPLCISLTTEQIEELGDK